MKTVSKFRKVRRIVGPIASFLRNLISKPRLFQSSPQYWEARYASGGTSGAGSYGRLAAFKAEVLNEFIATHEVSSVIELGSGDGAQLALARYPNYVGIDVSMRAVMICAKKFKDDPTKTFIHTSELTGNAISADITLSLDVIYHLVEDDIFHKYMTQLFSLSTKYVGIYSSNAEIPNTALHVRNRCFTDWVSLHAPGWKLIRKVLNPYPCDPDRPEDSSWADFFFFEKQNN